MKRVINFVKGKRDEKKDNKFAAPPISVEITNPAGQKIQSEDEHILGLQSGYGYQIDINGKDKSMTKLHKAAWQGNLDKVKVHLKKTDVNLLDNFNRTALHFAAAQGHSNIAWFLLGAKASLEVRDSDGMTPFLKAIECGNKECVNMILEKGADVNIVDRNGNNGLHLAAKLGFFNIASLLLKKGANFNCSNNVGEFPLHLATEAEHRELVELLLRSGAHVNVVDRDNRTPLMLAARYGLASFVSLFLEYNASLEACDSNGWTAEDYALIGGHQLLAADLKAPGREQINKEVDQAQENPVVCDIINEVESDASENVKNPPQTAEVEINAEPSELQSDKSLHSETIKKETPHIQVEDEKGEKKEDADNVESPRSCVTPPPLQPPRSWDLIQAGMIDEKEVQRRSLTALGTLRSRRESFNENNGAISPHSPHKGQGDFTDIEFDEDLKAKIVGYKIKIDAGGDAGSSGSEESLPLDKFPATPECHGQVSRPRSRLERAPSVDLTEEDPSKSKDSVDEKLSSEGGTLGREDTLQGYEEIWEKNSNINIINNINNNTEGNLIVADNNNSVINTNLSTDNTNILYDTGQTQVTTEISDQFLQRNREISNAIGYVTNEIYRTMIEEPFNQNDELHSNTQFVESNVNQPVHVSSSLDNLDDYTKKSFVEIESSRSCNNLDEKYMALEENLCSGIYSSDTMTDVTSNNENEGAQSLDNIDMSPVGTVVKRNAYREVHSLDMLDDLESCCSTIIVNGNEVKQINKRHSRNKSVSVNTRCWSKSFDVLSKPSNIDKIHVDTKKIDAQLECYDEALRELAQVEMLKRNSSSRSSKDSFSSNERKSESFSNKEKSNINDVSINSSSSSNSQHQQKCEYFLKLNDNKDFSKVNQQDSNNISTTKLIDKSTTKSVDSISTDSSDKFNINSSNFVEDFELPDIEVKPNNNLKSNFDPNIDLSLQDLPPPPDLTFNPNILSSDIDHNILPILINDNKSVADNIISWNDNNNGNQVIEDAEESSITKEFEKSLFKLEKDLYNIKSSVIKSVDGNIRENQNIVILPVECTVTTLNTNIVGEIPCESRNGHMDIDKFDDNDLSKHMDDDSSSAMDRSHEDDEEESPKPPPKHKKSLRKGRSEGEMRIISNSKNVRSYSTSTYNDIINEFLLDKFNWSRKKSASEIPPVNEKSESDSELCERPLRRKRKMLLAMRGIVAGSKDSDEDEDTSAGDPPFWLSTDKGGHFARQDTVISVQQSARTSAKQSDTKYNLPQSGTNDKDLNKEGQNEGDKWTSSDGETASGSGDITPGGRHTYTISSHHTMLKEHLRLATTDKTRLEELVAKLREQLDRQQYDLADARQAIAGKDDTIRIIEERAGRMEIKYATTLDELQTLQHHVTTQEVELKHLREHCEMITKEKAELREQLLLVQQKSYNLEKCPNCTEEKKRPQEDLLSTGESTKKANTLILLQKQKQETERRNEMLVAHLEEVMRQYEMIKKDKETIEAQNIADIKKLQQDTLMWKEKYEDCVARLEVLENECQPQLEESERIISTLHHTIQKMEHDKKQDQENWKSKFMDGWSKTLQEVRTEYMKAEKLLIRRIRILEGDSYIRKNMIHLRFTKSDSSLKDIYKVCHNIPLLTSSVHTGICTHIEHQRDVPDEDLLPIFDSVSKNSHFHYTDLDVNKASQERKSVENNSCKKSSKPLQYEIKPKRSISSNVFINFDLKLTNSEMKNLLSENCTHNVYKKFVDSNKFCSCFSSKIRKYNISKTNLKDSNKILQKLSAKDRLKLQELNELHEKELRHFENELKNCNTQLSKLLEENNTLSSQLKSKQIRIDELVAEIKTLGVNLSSREKLCNHLQEELTQCYSEKELLEKRLTDYKVEVKKLLKENKQIQCLEKRIDLLNHSVQQSTVETLKEDHKLKCLIDKIKSISQVTKEPLIKKENDHNNNNNNNSGDCMEMYNSVNKNHESSKSKKQQNDKNFNSSNNNDSDRFDSFTKTEKKSYKTNNKNTSNSKNIDAPFQQTVCDSTSFKFNNKTVSSSGDNNKFDAFNNNETVLKMYNYESFSNYGLDDKLPRSIIKSSDDTDQQNSVSTDKENDIVKCDKSINAYFFFSTLNFDSSYSNNNSAIKKSLSVQTVIDLEGSSSSYWDDEHTTFLYRRDDVNKINSMLAYQANDTAFSNTNTHSFNKIYNNEYCSLLPPRPIISSTSIKSNCSSVTGRSSVVMSFLIPFEKFRRWRSDETVTTNTFTKPDSAPFSELNVPVPNSTILDVHVIPSSSTAGVNHISSVEPELLQLQQKLVLESDKRQSLEKQVNKLIGDLQEKIDQNSNTNQKNVLTRENQEVADGRIRQQALLDSENNLSEKILQINSILQKQMEEQDRIREHSEMQMKKEFELTRQKLLMELSRVQSALKAKEAEERKLREKCDRLTRDVEKNAEIKRRQLIEKSYNINLAQRSSSWEKELSVKARVVVPPPPPPPMTIPVLEDFPLPTPESPFSHNSLRAQLHESIKKHRAESSLDQQSNVGTSNSGTHYDETLESSSKR